MESLAGSIDTFLTYTNLLNMLAQKNLHFLLLDLIYRAEVEKSVPSHHRAIVNLHSSFGEMLFERLKVKNKL